MIPAAVMMKLATLGLSPDHAEAVAQMLADVEQATKAEGNAAIETRRANDRERKSRQRHGKSRDVTGQDVTERDTPPSPSLPPQTPPTRPHPPVRNTSTREGPSRSELADEFAEFWSEVPRKVGRGQAEKAFVAARKHTEHSVILAGIRRYAAERRLEDPSFTKHPATWLNGKCWLDDPAPQPSQQTGRPSNGQRYPNTGKPSIRDQIREGVRSVSAGDGVRGPVEASRDGRGAEWPDDERPGGVASRTLTFERGEGRAFEDRPQHQPRYANARY